MHHPPSEARHRHHFVAEPIAAQAARRTLDPLTADIGADAVAKAQLLVSELIGNAVTHAGMGGRGYIGLDVSVTPQRLRIVVSDSGPGFDVAPHPVDPAAHRGRGLQLVEQVADRWGVLHSGKTRVWFEIDLHARPASVAGHQRGAAR
jgi:anti-sigma regulatory factor (Ser/Thr protein kinase)